MLYYVQYVLCPLLFLTLSFTWLTFFYLLLDLFIIVLVCVLLKHWRSLISLHTVQWIWRHWIEGGGRGAYLHLHPFTWFFFLPFSAEVCILSLSFSSAPTFWVFNPPLAPLLSTVFLCPYVTREWTVFSSKSQNTQRKCQISVGGTHSPLTLLCVCVCVCLYLYACAYEWGWSLILLQHQSVPQQMHSGTVQ